MKSLSWITFHLNDRPVCMFVNEIPMTDILLRMLLKSRMARSVYVTALPSSCVVIVPGVRERNTKPKLRAAVTNAPSSGD